MRKTLFVLSFTPVFLLALVAQHALACCVDNDQDGYGTAYLNECPNPNEFDCDDTNPDINPGVTEGVFGDLMCGDGVDNDCDGRVDILDEGCFECTLPGDCDDQNPCTDDLCAGNVCTNENNTAPCEDGDDCTMDDACSGGSCVAGPPLDADEDGFVSDLCGGNDCDDSDLSVNPGAWEGPADDPMCTDGVDNNCNGYMDLDDAGCVPGGGCAPAETADAAVYGAPSREGSGLSNLLFALLLPLGAVVLFRRILRKR